MHDHSPNSRCARRSPPPASPLLAACATPGAAPAAAPSAAAPPVVEAIPYRPIPPAGSTYAMTIPPLGPDGVRQTVNTGLDENETIWNLRSVWNVAALNCLSAQYQPILDGYTAFLKKNAKKLTAVNAALDKKYRTAAGSVAAGRKAREMHMTQVYNYFATPAAIRNSATSPSRCRTNTCSRRRATSRVCRRHAAAVRRGLSRLLQRL